MSHHINFNVTAQEAKQITSKTSKNESRSAKKRETKKLEIDNKQMEWRLHQLKLAMEREKEERGKKNYIWKSGRDGALESHARNILGKTVKVKSEQTKNSNKVKVSVLTDEPLHIPKRKSHSKDLIDKLMKPTPPQSKTFFNDTLQEPINKECWISVGIDRFNEDVMDIQSDHNGNLPLSTLRSFNSSAIGLYYMQYGRKRLILAIDNIVIQPKSGWGNNTYYPYMADISPQKPNLEPTSPSSVRLPISTSKPKINNEKGFLLNGSFNEEENAKSFQEAVMAWRDGKTTDSISSKSRTSSAPSTPFVETAAHGVQSDPVKNVEVKFSETSSLSFMEKILLKKHRVTDVPPLSGTIQLSDRFASNTEEVFLTAEELEEKERFRELFTPEPSNNKNSSFKFHDHTCTISEADSDDGILNQHDYVESSSYCFVEEVSDSDNSEKNRTSKKMFVDAFNLDHSSNKIQIEEVNFFEPITLPTDSNIAGSKKLTASNFKSHDRQSKMIDKSSWDIDQDKKVSTKNAPKSLNNTNSSNSNIIKNKTNKAFYSSNVVSAIGKIPFNPDAVYRNNLDHYCSEIRSEQSKILNFLDSKPNQIMLCNQVGSKWFITGSNDSSNCEDLSNINSKNNTFKVVFDMDENNECEQEDYKTLEKLEWEFASQNGHITDDGRISRIIDDWSSDENDADLSIVNDPGFGSGLSTPDPKPIALVGTSISWQNGSKMLQEFQKMEDFMLEQESLDSV